MYGVFTNNKGGLCVGFAQREEDGHIVFTKNTGGDLGARLP